MYNLNLKKRRFKNELEKRWKKNQRFFEKSKNFAFSLEWKPGSFAISITKKESFFDPQLWLKFCAKREQKMAKQELPLNYYP